jgi:O-phosphoseryl-tRNA(Cys) synthetase
VDKKGGYKNMNHKERILLVLSIYREMLNDITEDDIILKLKLAKLKSINRICGTWRKGQINGDEAMHEVMNILMMFE